MTVWNNSRPMRLPKPTICCSLYWQTLLRLLLRRFRGHPNCRSRNKTSCSSGNQVRAAKIVVRVATVFRTCSLMHLMLSVTIAVYKSFGLAEIISPTYTRIIPYMYLHSEKKFSSWDLPAVWKKHTRLLIVPDTARFEKGQRTSEVFRYKGGVQSTSFNSPSVVLCAETFETFQLQKKKRKDFFPMAFCLCVTRLFY